MSSPRLIGSLPNTYAYSKGLSEHLVTTYSDQIPIGIARPSIGRRREVPRGYRRGTSRVSCVAYLYGAALPSASQLGGLPTGGKSAVAHMNY